MFLNMPDGIEEALGDWGGVAPSDAFFKGFDPRHRAASGGGTDPGGGGDGGFGGESGTFTDPRDGKEYEWVKIDGIIWMAENLDWAGSGAYYNNASSPPFPKAGRLYTWAEAMAAAPPGWHLPTNEEWDELVNYAGGSSIAGKKLKATSGWNNNGNGTDEFGFAALPGGNGTSGGSFFNVGNYGYWWSASEGSSNYAYYRDMSYSGNSAGWNNNTQLYKFSVRLVKDA